MKRSFFPDALLFPIHSSASRREFLVSAAAVWGLASVPAPAPAQTSFRRSRLRVRYRTSAENAARVIPTPLMPGDQSSVLLEYCRIDPPHSPSDPAAETVHTFAVYIAVKHSGRSGWLFLGGATGNERWRVRGREFAGLAFKEGEIELARDGAKITASFARRGVEIQRVETSLTDSSPAGAALAGQPVFAFDYRLHYDWNASLIGPEAPQLLQIGTIESAGEAQSNGATPFQRRCDLEQTSLKWPEATPLDPYVELPALEVLEASYAEETGPLLNLFAEQQTAEPIKLATTPATFEPWSVLRYDRLVDRGRPWIPEGWRQTSTAFRLSEKELESWRGRKDIILDPADIIDIQIMIAREVHAELVPPPCRGGLRPVLRLMALRVDSSDLSPEPFDELWLFASCLHENQWAWYALAHIVGPGGDVIHGRETFGYPSKTGDVSAILRPDGFDLAAQRFGRTFAGVSGSTSGFSTGTSLDEMTVVSLRAESFRGGPPVKGWLIEQPWYFHGRKLRAARESLEITFPGPAADSRSTVRDPWFELGPVNPLTAATFEGGGMQRGPGRIVAEIPDVSPYYLERCDGALPVKPLSSPAEPSSFRPGRPERDSSTKTS